MVQVFYCEYSARPVLIIEDGHSSHVSLEVIKLARENDIYLLCLPSHCTHILQPLDVGFFKSLKANFNKVCKDFLFAHPGQSIRSEDLAHFLSLAWPKALTPVNVMKGFKQCVITHIILELYQIGFWLHQRCFLLNQLVLVTQEIFQQIFLIFFHCLKLSLYRVCDRSIVIVQDVLLMIHLLLRRKKKRKGKKKRKERKKKKRREKKTRRSLRKRRGRKR